ncbi:hypothetical protein AB1Y20_010830 [Prymnesium parvum]|uniref:AP2/ERF domain-containing protein n=1 Tax=Prymnesium parvum TaxID=97485 RepID=A0AB34IRV5_PRYPA
MGDCPAGFNINPTANRAVADEQPRPVERQKIKDAKLRWKCDALVAKKQTGKATGWTREFCSLYGSTETAAVDARALFLHEYMNPRTRARPSSNSKRTSPVECGEADVGTADVDDKRRSKRQAAPQMLWEPKCNTMPKKPCPGPGRGYKYVAARASELLSI